MRTQLGTRAEVRGRRVIHLSPGTKVTHAGDPQAACGDACGDKGDFMRNTPTRPNFPNFQDVKLIKLSSFLLVFQFQHVDARFRIRIAV